MAELALIVGSIIGISQVGLLTGIFFRLGVFEGRVEELFRRVVVLEKRGDKP